jgi:hypothetical protein
MRVRKIENREFKIQALPLAPHGMMGGMNHGPAGGGKQHGAMGGMQHNTPDNSGQAPAGHSGHGTPAQQ